MDASFPKTPVGGATGPSSLRGSLGQTEGLLNQPVLRYDEAVARIGQVRAGIPPAVVREMMKALGLTSTQAARLLGMTTRDFTQYLRTETALPRQTAEHVLALLDLSKWGTAVFADQDNFNAWLRQPLPLLHGEAPLALLDTDTGLQLVRQVLGRLAYGVYS